MKPVLFIVLHLGTVKDWQWSDTSVNLPKWASSQIYATAPALNNSVHCTSVLFHFYLFSPCQLSGAQIIATVSTGNAFFFFPYRAVLIRASPVEISNNNKEKQQKKWEHLQYPAIKPSSTWWHKSDAFYCDSSSSMCICSSVMTLLSLTGN